MAGYLLVRKDLKQSMVGLPLPEGELVVGRNANCNIVISDHTVSRQHAKLIISGTSVEVVDLQSLNGTFVDHRQVSRSLVQLGHELRFGAVAFVLRWVDDGIDDDSTGIGHKETIALVLLAQQLTPRQRRVYERLVAGLSEKQIANEFRISPHTVHVHVRAIYERFGVHSRAELLARHISANAD
jgi:DNA-binding CsgD family transcriptional regulator